VKSNALSLKVSGPVIPSGELDQPFIIFGLTIVLPVLAAYFGINAFQAKAAAGKRKKN
jgi:hypothetical protein